MFDLIFCATDDLQLCFNAPSVWSGGKGTLAYSYQYTERSENP